MLTPHYQKKFKKDLKLAEKRNKDINKIKSIIIKLINEEPLSDELRDHQLTGNYSNCRECHIEPDWLLIYTVDKELNIITFIRTGTHSDLFQ